MSLTSIFFNAPKAAPRLYQQLAIVCLLGFLPFIFSVRLSQPLDCSVTRVSFMSIRCFFTRSLNLLGLERDTFLGACLSSTPYNRFLPLQSCCGHCNHKLECYRETLAGSLWSPKSISTFPIRELPWLFLQGLCLFTTLITSILRAAQSSPAAVEMQQC